MRVFVAGATGALGKPLLRELVARGHDVVGLSRSSANDATLAQLGSRSAHADLFDVRSLAAAIERCDVVVRAATHIPKGAWTRDEIALMDRVRRDGTRALLDAAARVGARRYVQESVAWLEPEGALADAERAASAAPLDSATLRFGWFYGSGAPHTRAMVDDLRAGRLTLPGDASARRSLVHVEDAARALADAVVSPATGIWGVADERPVTIGDFFDALARAIGAPSPPRGGPPDPFLSMENVVDARAFREATGWSPRFPTLDEGLREVSLNLGGARPSSSS
jgi:2-alkyl-3-oxoalkanoate reductase